MKSLSVGADIAWQIAAMEARQQTLSIERA